MAPTIIYLYMLALLTVRSFAALAAAEPPTLCRLLLVRHGQTDFNADGRLQGRLESQLTAEGHAQTTRLGEWMATTESGSVDRVYVSPRKRTLQTLANVESKHTTLPPAEQRFGLREIELTMWEGQYKADVRDSNGNPDTARWARWKQDPDTFNFEEDGHSPFGDVKRRAAEEWAFLLSATPPSTTSLVVAHGAFNRVLMLTALGLPVDGRGFRDDQFAFENAATVELQWRAGASHASAWRKRYPSESEWITREQELERVAAAAQQDKLEL